MWATTAPPARRTRNPSKELSPINTRVWCATEPRSRTVRALPFKTITDGLSKTLLLSEAVQGQSIDLAQFDVRGLVWWGDAAGFSAYLPPNSSQPDIADFGSYCLYPFGANPPCVGWNYAPLSKCLLPAAGIRAESASRCATAASVSFLTRSTCSCGMP